MYRRHYVGSQCRLDQLSALTGDAEVPAQQRLRCSRAQAYHHLRFHRVQLSVKPGTAGVYLRISRLLVYPALAALCWRPFKVLYKFVDVASAPIDASFNQGLVKEPPRRSYEGVACKIFLISGLFAYKHDC